MTQRYRLRIQAYHYTDAQLVKVWAYLEEAVGKPRVRAEKLVGEWIAETNDEFYADRKKIRICLERCRYKGHKAIYRCGSGMGEVTELRW